MDLIDDEPIKHPLIPASNYHLNNPIRPYDSMRILGVKNITPSVEVSDRGLKNWENMSRFFCLKDKVTILDHSQLLYKIRENLEELGCPLVLRKQFDSSHLLANRIWNLSHPVMSSFVESSTSLPAHFQISTPNRELILSYYSLTYQLIQLVLLTASSLKTEWNEAATNFVEVLEPSNPDKSIGIFRLKFGKFQFTVNGAFCVVTIEDEENLYLLSREQLLLIQDTFYSRFLLLLDGALNESVNLDHHLSVPELLTIFSFGDSVLYKLGNKGYSLLAKWEAICISLILSLDKDPYCDPNVFIRNINTELKAEIKDQIVLDKVASVIHFLKNRGKINPSKLTQAHGLFRIWGHPVVDVLEGINKLRLITTRRRKLNFHMIRLAERSFKELFCTRYFSKKNRWPELDVTQLPKNSYLRLTLEIHEPLNIWDPKYRRAEWDLVHSKKTFFIPEGMELSEVLDDKSLSPPLHTVVNNLTKFKCIGIQDQKSVIMSFLRANYSNTEQFLKDIDLNGYGDQEELVGVCPKERELKLYPRFFGLLPLRKRLTVVLTESLIGKLILPFFPEITMMDDESALRKKFLKLTKSQDDMVKIVTNLDFMKWNSYMREEETIGIFKFLDGLFGFSRVISRTHELFKNSIMYLCDGSLIPPTSGFQIQESEISWRGHLGGIEGLRQKGWTIFTLILLHMVRQKVKIEIQILGQGDNQVLVFYFDKTRFEKDKNIKEIHQSFMIELEHLLSQIGPPLKVEETWSSSIFFIYGKFPIFKGCPLSMSMKKSCRAYSISNEGIPSLETALSSITANISASIASDYFPYVQFYLYLFSVHTCLNLHFKESPLNNKSLIEWLKKVDLTKPTLQVRLPVGGISTTYRYPVNINLFQIRHNRILNKLMLVDLSELGYLSIMLLPSSLGGFPIMLLPALLTRGFPDPLTLDISILRQLYQFAKSDLSVKQVIINILSPLHAPSINYRMLYEDPTSLNIFHPSTPKEILKRKLARFFLSPTISSQIKNMQFLTFISVSTTDKTELYNSLATSNPFNPRVIHNILEATLQGQAIKFLNKVNNSGVMLKKFLYSMDNPRKDLGGIRLGEINLVNSFLIQISNRGECIWSEDQCSTEWSELLRASTWKIPLDRWDGVTVASPIEAFRGFFTMGLSCQEQEHPNNDKGYVLVTPSLEIASPCIIADNPKLGFSIPFLGTRTIDKLSSLAKQLIHENPSLIQSALSLHQLIGWATSPNSHLAQLIRSIGRSFTNLDLSMLESEDNTVSGSVSHRFQDNSTKKGGLLPILYNIPSNITLSTNTLIAYSKGSANVNLHFQTLFLMIEVAWSLLIPFNRWEKLSLSLHFHQVCKKCIKPINENPIEVEQPIEWDRYLDSLPGNPFCWIGDSRIGTVDKYPTLPNFSLTEDTHVNKELLEYLIGSFVERQLRSEHYDMSRRLIETKPLNVSWIFKTNIMCVCYWTVFFIISQWMYLYNLKINHSLSLVKSKLISHIKNFSISIGVLFSSVSFNQEALDYMASYKSDLTGGLSIQSHQITYTGVADLFKRVLEYCLCTIEEFLSCRQLPKFVLERSPPANHPTWASCVKEFILTGTLTPSLYIQTTEIRHLLRQLTPYDQVSGFDLRKIILDPLHSEFVITRLSKDMILLNSGLLVSAHLDTLAGLASNYSYPKTSSSNNESLKFPLRCSSLNKKIMSHEFFAPRVDLTRTKPEMFSLGEMRLLEFSYQFKGKSWNPKRVPLGQSSAPMKVPTLVNLHSSQSEHTIALGDGAGGYTYLLLLTNPKRKVWYNSLIIGDGIVQHAIGQLIPTYLHGHPELRSRLINSTIIGECDQNLTHPSCKKTIIKNWSNLPPPSLIICDAEGSSWDNRSAELEITNCVLALAQELQAQKVIIKVYGGLGNWDLVIANLALAYYGNFHVKRSYMSYSDNSELFLICTSPLVTPRSSISIFKDSIYFDPVLTSHNSHPITEETGKISLNHEEVSLASQLSTIMGEHIVPSRVKDEVMRVVALLDRYTHLSPSKRFLLLINQSHPLQKMQATNSRRLFKQSALTPTTILSILRIYMIHLARYSNVDTSLIETLLTGKMRFHKTCDGLYQFSLTTIKKEIVGNENKTVYLKKFGKKEKTLYEYSRSLLVVFNTSKLLSPEYHTKLILYSPQDLSIY